MILVADSGSSKTLWVLRHNGMDIFMKVTAGLNPNFTPEYAIEKTIRSFVTESRLKNKISKVFFYGSGCGRKKGKEEIEGILKTVLPAAKIKVESDLVGAAHGLSMGKPSVSCILGTGSNACLYNGKKIVQAIPSYGFIFGDYGSGAHLGKLLLQDYFDNKLPKGIKTKLEKTADFSAEKCIENIYRKPSPNRFLAS
ncbi:MAG: ATPase, partial [Bacteroidia bacterium]|nr:ATPase [Bacteroidia bacterium]